MKLSIDISIFTDSAGAYGHVTGAIDFVVVPQIGDSISFAFPRVQVAARSPAFSGVLRVTDRIFNASNESNVSLALEDLTVPTIDDAVMVADLMVNGFGLTIDKY